MNDTVMQTLDRDKLDRAASVIASIKSEVAKALVGQGTVVDQVLTALVAAGHVLLEGAPGLGKTLLVRSLARTFSGNFSRIQFVPDLMPADVTGHAMLDMASREFKIRKGPVFTNLLLADEINRAPAKTQAALLEVMQEYQVTIEGQSLVLPAPFMTLATQNPIELEGTYPLPEAQLDRFLFKVVVPYPTLDEEKQMVERITAGQVGESLQVDQVNPIVKPETVITLQRMAALVLVNERVHDYAVRIVRATREWPGIVLGAGPRGGIALVRAARAQALASGSDFVTPDHVKSIAVPALRHRVSLAPDVQLEGRTVDQVLESMLQTIDAPRS